MPAAGSVEQFFSVSGDPGALFLLEFTMKLTVNSESYEHGGAGTIDALLDELGAVKAHTALMLNGDVIPAEQWETTSLNENDEIELLVFVGGG
jgi:sulfur carrier protein